MRRGQWRAVAARGKQRAEQRVFRLRGGGFDARGNDVQRGRELTVTIWTDQLIHEFGPELAAMRGVGFGEFHHVAEAAEKGRVDVVLKIGREKRDALVAFDGLEQMRGVGVGKTVLRVAHFGGTFGEDGIGFVEE